MDNKITTEEKFELYDFDPNATSATAVAWVDMRDFSRLLVSFFRTVGTSGLTFIIQASAAANGASPETILTKTISAEPDAVGDYVFAEISAEDIVGVASTSGKALRYVSAVLTFATGTDEGVITYVRSGARFKCEGLTADFVS
jgi:hypothetical protein